MAEEETRKIRDHKNRNKAEEALERKKERDKKNATQQLKILDEMLGVGIGSVRERNRLNKMIEEGKN